MYNLVKRLMAKPTTKAWPLEAGRLLATTRDYALYTQLIESPTLIGGEDYMYTLVHRGTKVIEYRTGNYPEGINQLVAFQSAYNNALQSASGAVEFVSQP